MKKEMRVSEQAMPQEENTEVLKTAEYGVLATISADDTPYITPVNFVYMDEAVYFHCALEGHRLENIAYNPAVCFNAVDSVVLMPEKFDTQYRSVTVFGKAEIVEDRAEKLKAISAIASKLSPDYKKEGMEYIESSFDMMHVVKINVEHMSGKATRE